MKSSQNTHYESLIKEVTAVCIQLQEFKAQLASIEHSYISFAISFDKEKQVKAKIQKILQFIQELKKRHAELVELVEQKVNLLRTLQYNPVGAAGFLKQERTQKELDEVEEKLKLLAVA